MAESRLTKEGQCWRRSLGTAQGAAIPVRLANIHLQYVFDFWVEFRRKVCT
jgi:hypothetical protein